MHFVTEWAVFSYHIEGSFGLKTSLTFSALQTKTYNFANSSDLGKTARNKPSHLDNTVCRSVLDSWRTSLFETTDAFKIKERSVHFISSRLKVFKIKSGDAQKKPQKSLPKVSDKGLNSIYMKWQHKTTLRRKENKQKETRTKRQSSRNAALDYHWRLTHDL